MGCAGARSSFFISVSVPARASYAAPDVIGTHLRCGHASRSSSSVKVSLRTSGFSWLHHLRGAAARRSEVQSQGVNSGLGGNGPTTTPPRRRRRPRPAVPPRSSWGTRGECLASLFIFPLLLLLILRPPAAPHPRAARASLLTPATAAAAPHALRSELALLAGAHVRPQRPLHLRLLLLHGAQLHLIQPHLKARAHLQARATARTAESQHRLSSTHACSRPGAHLLERDALGAARLVVHVVAEGDEVSLVRKRHHALAARRWRRMRASARADACGRMPACAAGARLSGLGTGNRCFRMLFTRVPSADENPCAALARQRSAVVCVRARVRRRGAPPG